MSNIRLFNRLRRCRQLHTILYIPNSRTTNRRGTRLLLQKKFARLLRTILYCTYVYLYQTRSYLRSCNNCSDILVDILGLKKCEIDNTLFNEFIKLYDLSVFLILFFFLKITHGITPPPTRQNYTHHSRVRNDQTIILL